MGSKSYSKGICWIDDCRIPFVDEKDIPNDMDKTYLTSDRMFLEREGYKPFLYQQNIQGRFPANILVCDDILNDGVISKSGNGKSNTYDKNWIHYGGKYKQRRNADIGDKGTNSRYYDIDKWFDKILND